MCASGESDPHEIVIGFTSPPGCHGHVAAQSAVATSSAEGAPRGWVVRAGLILACTGNWGFDDVAGDSGVGS